MSTHKIGDLVLYKDIIDNHICLGTIKEIVGNSHLVEWSTTPDDLMDQSTETGKTITEMKLNLKELIDGQTSNR